MEISLKFIIIFLTIFSISTLSQAQTNNNLSLINFSNLGFHVKDIVFTEDPSKDCQDCIVIGMLSYPKKGFEEEQLIESKFIAIKCRNTVSEYEAQKKCRKEVTSYNY